MAWTQSTRPHYLAEPGHYTSDLSDADWAELEPLLPEPRDRGRPRRHHPRLIVEALLYILVAGCQWRNLPHEFPPWQTVQRWFYRWRDDGTLERMHHALLVLARERAGREAAPSAGVFDAQTVKTVEGGPRGYDAGKKVLGRKRHALVDTEGNLVAVRVGPADVQDRDGIVPVLRSVRRRQPWLRHVWADGGYAGERVREGAAKCGGFRIEIVKRTDDMRGFVVLPRRWVVERTFAWLNRCRRLTKDFERTISSAEAWIKLAAIRLMLRRKSTC